MANIDKVVIIGCGDVGVRVARLVQGCGGQVAALARSDAAALRLQGFGIDPVPGDLDEPASLASLKLSGPPRGVIVSDVPERPDGGENTLKPKDIILRIDGFDLDIQGDYADPEFGHLMLENLATRNRWAGDDVKMRIFRKASAYGS